MLLIEDDRALLKRFAQTRDEAAFAEIVRRHADMVYAAARRQVADAHLAEDVTQAVFILLAQKAKSIGPKVVLAGWLYNAARMTAANARRSAQRRERNERKASEIMAAGADETIDWPAMEAQLDGAMSRLKSADRDALVLRFFERRSLREVGECVGISEDAAKVRVSRAIARLRRIVGISAPAAALAATMEANLAQAAPAGLALQLAPAALSASPTSAAAILAKGTSTIMLYAQMKMAAGVMGVMLLTGGAGVAIRQVAAADASPAAPAATQPAPATQPTPIAQDSPRATFLSIYDAITNYDPAGVRQCIHARDAAEAEVADAMADQLTSQGMLHKLLCDRFPQDGASLIPTRDQLKDLRQMIMGDKGTVIFGKMNFAVLKIDDKWYADAKTISSPGKPSTLPLKRQALEARNDAAAYRAVTKELQEGKLKSVMEVRQAFVKRRTDGLRAATQPATTTTARATRG